jgi:hypothetical protein
VQEQACLAVFWGRVDAWESAGLLVQKPHYSLSNTSGGKPMRIPRQRTTPHPRNPLASAPADGDLDLGSSPAASADESARVSEEPDFAALIEKAAGGLPRKHEGTPDYEKYQYGFPALPGRLFGSGN